MSKQRFITISPGFFLIMVLLARSRVEKPLELATWLIVATVSVLVHELGHALAARRFGCRPTISLHMMGGTTSYSMEETLSRGRRILISAAGPGSGLLFGGLVWTVHLGASGIIGDHPTAALIVRDALWVNIGWSLVNLLPVLPLDGGQITAQLVGKGPARWISIITAAVIAVAVVGYGYTWMGVLLGWLIIENGRTLWRKRQEKRDTPLLTELERSREFYEAGRFEESLVLARDIQHRFRDSWNQHLAASRRLWAAIQLDDKEEMDIALATFPQAYPANHYESGIVHQKLGRLESAEDSFSRALETDAGSRALNALLLLLTAQKRYRDVLKVLEANPADDVDAEAFVTMQAALIVAGRYEDALQVGCTGYEVAEDSKVAYNFACTHALMGETTPALSWLKKAMEGGHTDIAQILCDDDLVSIRDTEEFRYLLRNFAVPKGTD